MVYLILPPLLIILGIAVLLYIFSRKAGKIANLSMEAEEKLEMEKKSLLKRFLSFLGRFFLKFLEHLSQKTKVMFLKLHNWSNNAFHKIREKRKKVEIKNTEGLEAQAPLEEKNIPEQALVKKVPAEFEVKKEDVILLPDKAPTEITSNQSMVQSPTKGGKSEYEEALIERIALNPKDIEAYERLGDYYIEAKNYIDAKQCLEQVLALSPGYRRAKLKMRRIEKILKVEK